jgi:hypothetical protein
VDPDSPTGVAYDRLARRERRRRDDLAALVRSGLSDEDAAAAYSRDHPLDRPATAAEVRNAGARGGVAGRVRSR